jgi:cytoskeletal protein RodZ
MPMVLLGEELKRERELRDISLREISEATKISIRILEAIEHNNYKILPGGVFNRNFLRAYAQFVGLDPESVVNKYQQQVVNNEEESLPEFISLVPEQRAPTPSSRNSIIVAVSLLIIVLVLVFLWYTRMHLAVKKSIGQEPVYQSEKNLVYAFFCTDLIDTEHHS